MSQRAELTHATARRRTKSASHGGEAGCLVALPPSQISMALFRSCYGEKENERKKKATL